MNPSYTAYNKAFLATIMNTLMGIEPPAPKAKKDPNVGPAFAKNVGVQQDEPSEEKEAKVQAHLDKLAAECKQRYLDGLDELPYVKEMTQSESTAEWVKREMKRNRDLHTGREYLPDEPDPIAEEKYPSVIIAQTGEMSKAAYDQATKTLLKLAAITEMHNTIATPTELREKAEPKYPRSDMVEALEEEMERVAEGVRADQLHAKDLLDKTTVAFKAAQAKHGAPHWMPGQQRDVDLRNAKASNACVHSGERGNLNYDNYTNEAL